MEVWRLGFQSLGFAAEKAERGGGFKVRRLLHRLQAFVSSRCKVSNLQLNSQGTQENIPRCSL